MKFKVGRTFLVVTKPSGEMLKKEVILYADDQAQTIGIKFVGDGPLKGYAFDLMDIEIARIRTQGVQMQTLPDRI